MSSLIKKGLITLLKTVKLADPNSISEIAEAAEKYIDGSSFEIQKAYQNSYRLALKAILAGLGKISILEANTFKEFASQIKPHYLEPFAAAHNLEINTLAQQLIAQGEKLSPSLEFNQEKSQEKEQALAQMLSSDKYLSITEEIIEKLSQHSQIDKEILAFLRYGDLLGRAITYFLEEELRNNQRFYNTLDYLIKKGLAQDTYKTNAKLEELFKKANLLETIRVKDESTITHPNILKLIKELLVQLEQLPTTHPLYSALNIKEASLLSSSLAGQQAEKSLQKAKKNSKNEGEKALASYNLFQLEIRNKNYQAALKHLQLAIKLNPYRYALHDLEEYPVIEKILGAGGMGVVFLCRNKLGKPRVIKSFWESIEGSEDEVFYEARVMNEIAGEYIPEPLTFGYLDKPKKEKAYLVTEYIEGVMDAETWLRKKGCLRLNEGLKVGLQIAKGLELAHQKGILHLDLKPSNLLLREDDLKVKIIDFGLSRFVKNVNEEINSGMTLLRREAAYGTRDYGCPEQLGRDEYGMPSFKCDLFAFGKTLYRLLTNRPAGENMNPNYLPVPALYDLLMACVSFVPDERPASAKVLVEALEQIQNSENKPNFWSFLGKIFAKNSPRPATPTPLYEKEKAPAVVEDNLSSRDEFDEPSPIITPSYERKKAPAVDEFDEIEAYFNEAVTYVENAQLDKAYALLQEIPETHEKWQLLSEKIVEAYYELALESKGEEAKKWIEKGLSLDASHEKLGALKIKIAQEEEIRKLVDNYYQQALSKENRGEYEESMALIEQGLSLNPSHEKLRALFEKVGLRLKKLEEIENYYQLALAKVNKKAYEAAKVWIDKGLSLEPSDKKLQALKKQISSTDIYTNSIGMKFKLIKAGKFQMGSEKYDDEKPVHWVEITKDFYMGIFQVTVGQYKKYVDEKGGHFEPDYNQQGDNAAVTHVSWNDAQEFISWLNEKEGGEHYRLPTEAEWEYAARAGTTTEYSFGDDASLLGDYAWYSDNREGAYAHIVGQKKPNPWGLYDMHGNVWEWTCSEYESKSSGKEQQCVKNVNENNRLSVRGGSWDLGVARVRSADRNDWSPTYRGGDVGLRVARL
jgi:formylglycine-generating enzyme required for sulfatase activity/serine/threonine protein kinase